jgi:hypothetical protein
MFNRWIAVVALAGAVGVAIAESGQGTPAPANQNQGTPPTTATPAPVRSGGIVVPTITLGPGFTPVPNYDEVTVPDPPPQIPEGFTPLFNGKDLSGWHVRTGTSFAFVWKALRRRSVSRLTTHWLTSNKTRRITHRKG